MIEQLEKQIDKFFGIEKRNTDGIPIQNVSDWKETPETMMSMNAPALRSFAQHFYNLALQDIKKEVEIKRSFTSNDEIGLQRSYAYSVVLNAIDDLME